MSELLELDHRIVTHCHTVFFSPSEFGSLISKTGVIRALTSHTIRKCTHCQVLTTVPGYCKCYHGVHGLVDLELRFPAPKGYGFFC